MPVHSRVTTPSSFATGKTKRVPFPVGDPIYMEDFYDQRLVRLGGANGEAAYSGIDLENKGGMVIMKTSFNDNQKMVMFNTLTGVNNYYLIGENTSPQYSASSVQSFTTTGITLGSDTKWNANNRMHMMYTFAKQEKFFDMVRYTGNGVAGREIAHNLNGEVGMVWIKKETGPSDWQIGHRGLNEGVNPWEYYQEFKNSASVQNDTAWDYTAPTTTHITLGDRAECNAVAQTYIAFIFGHNELESEKIFGPERNKPAIFCGRLGASQNGIDQNIGMPAQFYLSKTTKSPYTTGNGYGDSWRLIDAARGMNYGDDSPYFTINESHTNAIQEGTFGQIAYKSARGFTPQSQGAYQASVYMAIGADSYNNPAQNQLGLDRIFVQSDMQPPNTSNGYEIGDERPANTRKQIDMFIQKKYTNTSGSSRGNNGEWKLVDRDSGGKKYVYPSWTANQGTWSGDNEGTRLAVDSPATKRNYRMAGHGQQRTSSPMSDSTGYFWGAGWTLQRKFFDIQTYVGDNTTAQTVYHNLEAEPEMVWIKSLAGNEDWFIYHKDLGTSWKLGLNLSTGRVSTSTGGKIVSADGEKVVVGKTSGNGIYTNNNDVPYRLYLFASFPTFSKIGTYTANAGYNIDIDCGFTWTSNGPALLIIKRTDAGSSGEWMWYAREYSVTGGGAGIGADGTGSRFLSTSATPNLDQLPSLTEYVYRTNTGFRVADTGSNPANESGGEYMYYIIAPDT